jgi:hypothetical protein
VTISAARWSLIKQIDHHADQKIAGRHCATYRAE